MAPALGAALAPDPAWDAIDETADDAAELAEEIADEATEEALETALDTLPIAELTDAKLDPDRAATVPF